MRFPKVFPSPGDLPDPGINLGLPHCWQIPYCLNPREAQFVRPSVKKEGGTSCWEIKNFQENNSRALCKDGSFMRVGPEWLHTTHTLMNPHPFTTLAMNISRAPRPSLHLNLSSLVYVLPGNGMGICCLPPTKQTNTFWISYANNSVFSDFNVPLRGRAGLW